ncbi:MAG: hypothetical protein ACHQTF_11605, partial [Gemmatimonadales bacterium]
GGGSGSGSPSLPRPGGRGPPAPAADPSLGDLRALAGVSRLPVRHPCALLGWTALAEALASRA